MKIPRNVKHISSRTRCRAESPSSPLSLSPQSLLSPLSLCLSHSPSLPSTHAHPRCSASTCNLELHFPFPLSPISPSHNPHSLSPLSVSHMHTCACTPRTRFPFELSWQLSPPLSSPPPPLSLSFFLLSAIQIKNTLYCLDRDETCAALQRALRHHLTVADDVDFNRWLESKTHWMDLKFHYVVFIHLKVSKSVS